METLLKAPHLLLFQMDVRSASGFRTNSHVKRLRASAEVRPHVSADRSDEMEFEI